MVVSVVQQQADDERPQVVLYGPLPVTLPVHRRILRAEVWALLQLLRSCVPPITVYVDNASVVRGVEAGKRWCCAAARPHADVWRKIWVDSG